MTLSELKEFGATVGLGMDNVQTTDHARALIIKAAREIVNY